MYAGDLAENGRITAHMLSLFLVKGIVFGPKGLYFEVKSEIMQHPLEPEAGWPDLGNRAVCSRVFGAQGKILGILWLNRICTFYCNRRQQP
jgi:hypothetical protein